MRWRFLLAAALLIGPPVYKRLFPPAAHYVNDVTHFKYGSVGAEAAAGIPYQVWRTLPGVCLAETDPKAAYKRFGFQWEPGHAAPVGMPIEKALVPRVGVSCAMCHVGRVDMPDGRSALLVGAPQYQPRPAGLPALPVRLRGQPEIHRRRHPRRERPAEGRPESLENWSTARSSSRRPRTPC